jgi:molybdate transport system ATP-binding protein
MILEIDVRGQYGRFALDATCHIEAPVTGLFGPSGAGKTTLLHLVAGLMQPKAGHVALDGDTLYSSDAGICTAAHQRHIGLVFQDDRLFPHLTVRGNLRFAEKLAPRNAGDMNLDTLSDILELDDLLDQPVGGLSGGQRRRVALGRAILAGPRLLLLDEPLAGLDRGRKEEVLGFLTDLHAATGIPMVVVSHDLREILTLTEELVILDSGSVVGQGRWCHLMAMPHVRHLMRGHAMIPYDLTSTHARRQPDANSLPSARAV